jgi:hypothetical protein
MKIIITGATGMVGRSTLNECLANDKVKEVLAINRRSLGLKHPKFKELIHSDFFNFSEVVEHFTEYDACFHCMGVTSVGKDETEFTKFTFDISKSLADACYIANPDMVMNYVSGAGTDSTEKGNTMWARVKGKTENYILNKGFKDAYMFRLGALIPEGEVSSGVSWYKYIYIAMTPLFPLLKKLSSFTTSSKFGKAMINTVLHSQEIKHLENTDINAMATKL